MKFTQALALSASLLALAACSSGGGNNFAGGTTSTPVAATPVVPNVSLGPATLIQTPAAPLLASGTTTPFTTGNVIGRVYPLTQNVELFNSTSVSDYAGASGATLTFVGVKSASGATVTTGSGPGVYLLTVPGLALGSDAQLANDGTSVTLANGGQAMMLQGGCPTPISGNGFMRPPAPRPPIRGSRSTVSRLPQAACRPAAAPSTPPTRQPAPAS